MKNHETIAGEMRLNLILFMVEGVRFAVDAEQVMGMSGYITEEHDNLRWFHELLGFGSRDASYQTPTILSILTAEHQVCRVVIDNVDDIAEYCVDLIAPLPALLEPFAVRNGIWGVLKRESGLTMLVDFHRITSLPV